MTLLPAASTVRLVARPIGRLVDDVFLMNRDDTVAARNEHPHIEIRVFNPWHKRGSLVQRGLENLGYSERLNQRMHNKLFAVDNRIAIIGGRNISDAHFGLSDKYNFRDLDAVVAGPMVDKVPDNFDLYWNDQWTVSASAFARPDSEAPLQEHMLREGAALLEREMAGESAWRVT